jgi:hypothetical protein
MLRRYLFLFVPLILVTGCGSSPRAISSIDVASAAVTGSSTGTALPVGTLVHVRLDEALDTDRNHAGDGFTATLDKPIIVEHRVIVPAGTRFKGHVTDAKPSGRLNGRAYLGLGLDSFAVNGATYAITTSSVGRVSGAHRNRNLALIGGGAGLGAAIGGIAGGGKGALIGGGAGAAAGTGGAALTGKKQVHLPVETALIFSLKEPIQVRTKS